MTAPDHTLKPFKKPLAPTGASIQAQIVRDSLCGPRELVARHQQTDTPELSHDGLVRLGAGKNDIAIVRVPGAFEIPVAARTLALTVG